MTTAGLKCPVVCFVVSMTMVLGGAWAAAPSKAVAVGVRTTCSTTYLDGDARLGPAERPTAGSLYPVAAGYQPLAGLTASQFLAIYWNPTANGGSGGWNYPPDNGFVIGPGGQPEEFPMQLGVGLRIDRFGSVFGAFLAPFDTPYAQRAIPPMSMDNFDPAFTCNYHLYQVVKAFKVEAGPIAPGFGQPGLGRQYQLVSALVPGSPSPLSVMWLLGNGYLKALPVAADSGPPTS